MVMVKLTPSIRNGPVQKPQVEDFIRYKWVKMYALGLIRRLDAFPTKLY